MASDTLDSTEQHMNEEQKLLWERLFKEIDDIKKLYSKQDQRISSLEALQYKIMGGAAVVSVVASAAYAYIMK